MSKSANKRNAIMANIQKIRNEIEEIRQQNNFLLEAIKPYENWYEKAEQIIYSTSKINKKIRSNKNKNVYVHHQDSSDLSSTSLSSEGSDSDVIFEKKNENDSDSDNDEEYIETPKLVYEDKNKIKKTNNLPVAVTMKKGSPPISTNFNISNYPKFLNQSNQLQNSNANVGKCFNYVTPQYVNNAKPNAFYIYSNDKRNQEVNTTNNFHTQNKLQIMAQSSHIQMPIYQSLSFQQSKFQDDINSFSNQPNYNEIPIVSTTIIKQDDNSENNANNLNYQPTNPPNQISFSYQAFLSNQTNSSINKSKSNIHSPSQSPIIKLFNQKSQTNNQDNNISVHNLEENHTMSDSQHHENDINDIFFDFSYEPPINPEIQVFNREFDTKNENSNHINDDKKEKQEVSEEMCIQSFEINLK